MLLAKSAQCDRNCARLVYTISDSFYFEFAQANERSIYFWLLDRNYAIIYNT